MERCYPDPAIRSQAVAYMQADSTDWKEFPIRTRFGTVINSIWSNVRLSDSTQIGIGIDITDRKQWERNLQSMLHEKETLLQEIHHRVKNNMQVISSLLKLQTFEIEDPKIKTVFNESQSRIYAMSAIHETLYGSDNLADIDLKTYLNRISEALLTTFTDKPNKVRLRIETNGLRINLKKAAPLGLAINELISNALKYAFPGDRNGTIDIRLEATADQTVTMVFADDGIGLPEDINWQKPTSLGLKLVNTLIRNQLDGTIDLEQQQGTRFVIRFSIAPT